MVLALLLATVAATAPITQAQSSRTYRVAKGGELTLRLSERWAWTEPHASGHGLQLTPVEYFRDPGYREWRVDAVAPGTFTIRAAGTPVRRFVVTIRVS
jgi:predicted secreted protein